MKMTYEEAAKALLHVDGNTSAEVEALELAKDLLRDVVCLEGKLAVQRSENEDLISRADALSALKGVIARTGGFGVSIEVILANLPPVEAEPVVHAHWKAVLEPNTVDNYGRPVYHAECSACGCRWGHVKEAREFFKRCRICGAKMDEVVADGHTD